MNAITRFFRDAPIQTADAKPQKERVIRFASKETVAKANRHVIKRYADVFRRLAE